MSDKSETIIADLFFELRKSWGVGGENYNFVIELMEAVREKGLQDGAAKEYERLVGDPFNTIMGKPISYWMELDANVKRYGWNTSYFHGVMEGKATKQILELQAELSIKDGYISCLKSNLKHLSNDCKDSIQEPPFDAEEVRGLLLELCKTSVTAGKHYSDEDWIEYVSLRDSVFYAILTALGLE